MSAHESPARWVDVIRELGICDETGHVQACGYEENEVCFCSTLPLRLKFLAGIDAALTAERERIAEAVEKDWTPEWESAREKHLGRGVPFLSRFLADKIRSGS